MVVEYHVTSTRTVSEEEARRRLARVYSLLIDLAQKKRTADREEFGDPDRPAGDVPASQREVNGG